MILIKISYFFNINFIVAATVIILDAKLKAIIICNNFCYFVFQHILLPMGNYFTKTRTASYVCNIRIIFLVDEIWEYKL